MTELFVSIITALFAIVSGYAEIERRRIIKALATLETENGTLKKTVSDYTTRLANAEERINSLKKSEIMYGLLKDNHEQLQQDHDGLKKDFEQKKSEWETAQRERDAERQKNGEMMAQNHGLFEANKKLAATIVNYEQVFKLMGQKLLTDPEKQSTAPEPGEHTEEPEENKEGAL